ncbi:MAG TPA: rhodanese-like domain-containing protein [Myxococcota bacterium]|nr:rhodanese-like domain-containing protein [Myxococcota bacterium]
MIRDRLKNAARKAMLKVFNMEFDAQETAGPPQADPKMDAATQASYMPPIVQGSGDTPGPNHKTDIGRTWLAAQVASGAGPVLVDLRPPPEVVAGMLPGAYLLPGQQLKNNLHLMPAKSERVVIYDQIGGDDSDQLASWLREQGWEMARRLRGGYAEWVEYDEPIELPQPPAGAKHHLGVPVEDAKGRRGSVQKVTVEGGKAQYLVLLDSGELVGPLAESDLRS